MSPAVLSLPRRRRTLLLLIPILALIVAAAVRERRDTGSARDYPTSAPIR